MLYGIFVTICFSNENKIDVAESPSLFLVWCTLEGSPFYPIPVACFVLLFILTINLRIWKMWLFPVFTGDQLFIGDKSLIPTKPCCLFIVSQYVSWRIQTLEFYFDRYLEATIFFLEWKYLSEKWHVGKKQNCFARCLAPSPWSSLYFRSIVVGQKYS